MPDDRLQRTRATLPAGYQFGDAATSHAWQRDAPMARWQYVCGALAHRKAADIIERAGECRTDNSDQHLASVERSAVANGAPCRHRGALLFDFTRNAYTCPCGAFVPADL